MKPVRASRRDVELAFSDVNRSGLELCERSLKGEERSMYRQVTVLNGLKFRKILTNNKDDHLQMKFRKILRNERNGYFEIWKNFNK